jgi:multicomponent Na+:H+ antiporter subunit B
LPKFGDAQAPANAYVGKEFIEHTPHDVGTPNIVTAVLASYRGFDTFGETVVVFGAGVAVILLIGFGERARAASDWRGKDEDDEEFENNDDSHMVLRVVSKFLIPLIAIFAFYVHFHGEYSPGGGFQAGVIFAVAVILYALIFGLKSAMKAFPPVWARVGAAIGVAVYGITGVICMLNGGNFLDYDYIFGPPSGEPHGHHNWPQITGIIGVEVGVVLAVACVMITLFYAFAGRVPEIRDEDW